MPEERKNSWFGKLAKAARNLAPDKNVVGENDRLKVFHEACQQAALEAMAGQEMLEKSIEENAEFIVTWENRAQMAKQQENEALAVQALQRKASYMKSTLEFQSQLPLLRQRRIHVMSRLESVNTIVHRLLILKDLLAAMPLPKTLKDELIGAIKNFLDELPSFSKVEETPSFNKAMVVAEQKITKLEQQIAHSARKFKETEPEHAAELDEVVAGLKATNEAAIAKVKEHLTVQSAIRDQREAERNEDSAWEARQLIWSDEKTLEVLTSSLQALESIVQPRVKST